MITSIEQCKEIQKRRVALKKRGYAKAVRTFLLKEAKAEKNVENRSFYRDTMNSLKVTWFKPEEKSI